MADIASGGNSQLQLKGAAQLAKGLRQAGADLKDLRDINEQAAQIVAPAAKALAPQRSGRLAKSIRAGATQKAGVVRAGNNGKNPSWLSYEKLRVVIEKKMFSNTEDLLPVISFNAKASKEDQQKHNDFVKRMVERGYTEKQVRLLSEWYLRVRKSQ